MSHAITKDGARIYYREVGDRDAASTLVLIQGFGLSSRFWFDLPERLAGDPAHPRRILLVDNRGTGESREARAAFDMGTLADDVAAVMDDANAKPATIVGISLGGMIAQHLAIRHPAKVQSLVLLATMAGLPYARVAPLGTFARLLAIGLGRDRSGQKLVELVLPEAEMHRARELFSEWPEAMRASRPSTATILGQVAAILRHSTGFALPKVTVPTIVVAGEKDVLIPPRNSEILARRIAGARLEILPGVGHAILVTDADAVRRAVEMVDA